MAVLITTDDKKEMYLVKEMIDTGMLNIPKSRKEKLAKAGIPTKVKITYNLIGPELVEKMKKKGEDETTNK